MSLSIYVNPHSEKKRTVVAIFHEVPAEQVSNQPAQLPVKQNILLKPISVSKSSMSVSSNNFDRFLNFALKIRKQLLDAMKELG